LQKKAIGRGSYQGTASAVPYAPANLRALAPAETRERSKADQELKNNSVSSVSPWWICRSRGAALEGRSSRWVFNAEAQSTLRKVEK